MTKSASSARPRRLALEICETRACLASNGWDGPGLGAANLSYYVGTVPANVGVTQAQFETTVRAALEAWSAVAQLNFTRTTQPGLASALDFTFATIDGSGRTLAQAYFPADVNRSRIAGDVQFDRGEQWEVGNARGGAAFDLLQVAVHEVGHALGLDHSRASGSVMADSVSANQSFRSLPAADVTAIRSLYAARTTPATTPTTTTPTPTTPTNTTPTTTRPTTPTTTPTTNTTPRWFTYWSRWWNSFSTGRFTSPRINALAPSAVDTAFDDGAETGTGTGCGRNNGGTSALRWR